MKIFYPLMSVVRFMEISKYNEKLIEVKVSRICVNPYQPRRYFSENELEELAASIKEVGILHPPLVRPVDGIKDFDYEIISGERRFRAAQKVGLESIKVLVRSTSEKVSAQAALIENVQRVDLNPIEIAKALRNLIDEFNFSQEEIARRIGKKRSTVSNYLRLLTLPEKIQESIGKGEVSMGHAKAILSQENEEHQNHLHALILKENLTVRKAEKINVANRESDLYLSELTDKLCKQLGTKVEVQGKGGKGRIIIDYYSLDDLDRVLNFLGYEGDSL